MKKNFSLKKAKNDGKGGRKSHPFFKRLLAGASWAAVVLLWLSAASVYVNPSYFRFAGVIGLAFPFFLAVVVFMQIVMLIFSVHRAWVPLLGLCGCILSIRDYVPINVPSAPPKGAMKVISYNVNCFSANTKDETGTNVICAYVKRQRPDILCMQEAHAWPTIYETDVEPVLRQQLAYADTMNFASSTLACFSRYPIIGKKRVCDTGSPNGATDFTLLLAPHDTLHVINCHLESMHLSQDDRSQYHEMVVNPENSTPKASSRMLVSKISNASVVRSRQTVITAAYVERLLKAGKSVILCGDFNDTPISYTRHRIASTGLTDAYVTTANGIGRSFNRDAIYVRIDNMFCSPDWKPYDCQVDASIKESDHYPIISSFKRKK